VEDDRPRHHGQDEEDDQDALLERPDVSEDLAETAESRKSGHGAQTLETCRFVLCNKTSCAFWP
jgi:hypothetical protein